LIYSKCLVVGIGLPVRRLGATGDKPMTGVA
jgi:hypothetical protein